MAGPPAVIIVVRHGARLDAADKQWHLTSPTPYDPPLTYGGWSQSRALGARIASILRSRENDPEETEAGERKRRHRVVIHTSPFLRCVQTSIGISAGLAQNPGHSHKRSNSTSIYHSSPKLRPIVTESPRLAPIAEPHTDHINSDKSVGGLRIAKSTLRVDAWLGEWLSPDYFEQITPPPSSIMMVAGAKADLLRKEDTNRLINLRDLPASAATTAPVIGFPGGWGSPVVKAVEDKDAESFTSMSSLSAALPRRDRTSSLSSVGTSISSSTEGISTGRQALPVHGSYNPPIPSYAISSTDQIPQGYVSHARDACVDVDYQWDSMREPHNWGTGGEYGEEWSSMHKRFRRGIQSLVTWYRNDSGAVELLSKVASHQVEGERANDCDADTDLVVILVTHGAGCNALIGALTNQPVLLDVGMASLTMAVYKSPTSSVTTSTTATPSSHSRTNSRTLTLSDEYEVRLVANVEHIRSSSSSTPSSSRSTSLTANRSRFVEPGSNLSYSGGRSMSATNFGSIRRVATVASTPLSQTYVSGRHNSIGLWSAAPQSPEEAGPIKWGDPKSLDDTETKDSDDGDDMVLNFGDAEVKPPDASDAIDENSAIPMPEFVNEGEQITDHRRKSGEEDDVPELGRLWDRGNAMKLVMGGDNIVRDPAPKRRWTVNERGTG